MKKAKCLLVTLGTQRHRLLAQLTIVVGAILLMPAAAAAFPVTIDARALSSSQFLISGQPGAFDSSQVQVLDLAPGDYSFGVDAPGGFFFFLVTADGTVDYMPTFDAVASGRGTSMLVVNGLEVTIDARELFNSGLTLGGLELSTRQVQTLRLLAAPKNLRYSGSGQTTLFVLLRDDGTWDYPSQWNAAFEGRGTNGLRIRGFPITVDLSPLTRPNFPLSMDFEQLEPAVHSQPFVARLLPGSHITGSGDAFFFRVTDDGIVDYDIGLDAVAEGRGTSALRLVGLPLEIDARSISSPRLSFAGFSGGAEFSTDTLQTLHLTPGGSNPIILFVSGTADNPHHQFSVFLLEDGTVDYWHGYDGFLSGRGTSRLTISGFPVTVDAREAAFLEGTPEICIGDIRFPSVPTPTVLRLPPGSYRLNDCGTHPLPFRVSLDGTVDFAPSHDAFLGGRGASTLLVHRISRGSGNRFDIRIEFLGDGMSVKFPFFHVSGGEGVPFLEQQFSSDETPTLSLQEGFYKMVVPAMLSSLVFSVTNNGTVDYYPSYDAFFSGRGTSTLRLNGFPITIDPRPLQRPTITLIEGVRAGDETHSFLLLPAFKYGAGEGAGNAVIVTEDGKVDYASFQESFLAGRGSATLTVNGLPVMLDFQGPAFSNINFQGTNFFTGSMTTLRLLPLARYSFSYGANNGVLDWALRSNGTVDFAARIDNFMTGRGTSMLHLSGAPVTVDVTALTSPTFRVFDSPFLSRNEPQTFRLLPGQLLLIPAGNRGAQFRLLDNATIGLFPTFASFLSGEGSNTLVDVGLPLEVDARGLAGTTPSFTLAGLTLPTSEVAHLRLHPGVFFFSAGELGFLFSLGTNGFADYAPSFDNRVRGRGTAQLEIGGNQSPVANAGADQNIGCAAAGGTAVTLDGSASSGPDGDALHYEWRDANGNVVGTEAQVNVTLPLGAHTFTLTVSDGKGGTASDSVTVTITVGVTGLLPPLAALVLESELAPLPGKAFKQGSTLPLRLQLFCGASPLTDFDVPAPQIVALERSGEPIDLTTVDVGAGEANDSGVLFRFSDGNWVYNLNTAGLSVGTYTITLQLPDGRRVHAGFVLR